MKYLFVVLALCVFLATPALADEPINGAISVDSITVYEGDPAPASDLEITFTTCLGQGPYVLPATATGDLLGGTLVAAHLAPASVDVGLDIILDPNLPDGPPTFALIVRKAELGSGDFCD